MPLHLFHSNCRVIPLFTLNELDVLTKIKGYFLGSTNQLLLQFPKSEPDCVINLDSRTFNVNNGMEKELKLTKYEKAFIKNLTRTIMEDWQEEDENWTSNLQNYHFRYFEREEWSLKI